MHPPARAAAQSSRRRIVLLGVPSALLFAWTAAESFGLHHPLAQLCVTTAILVCLPLGWVVAWVARRRARAVDDRARERIEQIILSKSVVMVFQPIVDCGTGRAIGTEALSRFVLPESTATPEYWFAEAARLGLGTQLELCAAELALEAAASLPEDVYVSINLSPAAILTGELTETIRRTGWHPARLVLEITEHASVDDYAALNAAIGGLRRRGLRLAVDDAGASYASFRHILALGPDYIKLDRSLVADVDSDPGRRALTSAVITFAAEIGATVIAEGIETEAELRTMRRLGVHAAQGLYTGRPHLPSEWPRQPDASPQNAAAALIGTDRHQSTGC